MSNRRTNLLINPNWRGHWHLPAIVIALLFVLAVASPALSCGPFFPNSVIGKDALTRAPIAHFRREVAHLLPEVKLKAKPPDKKTSVYEQTTNKAVGDVIQALKAKDIAPERRNRLIKDYKALRQQVSDIGHRRQDRREKGLADQGLAQAVEKQLRNLGEVPNVGAQFEQYLRGAIAYHAQRHDKARQHWEHILDLPARRRRYRSTWASYMIGRSLVESNPKEAVAWFETTRNLAAAGFRDSLGLAAASLGWQARAELNRTRDTRAVELYLQQAATGDKSAYASLRFVAADILNEEEQVMRRAAGHRATQAIVAAYLLARNERADHAKAWLDVVSQIDRSKVAGADRLGWLAYQRGQYKRARRWLDRYDGRSAVAAWLQAKLLMRRGELDQAVKHMAAATRRLAKARPWPAVMDSGLRKERPAAERLRGERGALSLARGDFTQALHLLIKNDYWRDAAYIAERVLTPDELKQYVDQHWQNGNKRDEGKRALSKYGYRPKRPGRAIRHLLARRLTRIGRWQEARPYYPRPLRDRLDAYIRAIRAGHDESRNRRERARQFWIAARIARHEGMQLLGSELTPDYAIYGGQYHLGSIDNRLKQRKGDTLSWALNKEMTRVSEHSVTPEKRFHYRYTACDHAWSAARLLPDGKPITARVLCLAGSWLKVDDPEYADRFYKAMVNRGRGTKLGQKADKRRWFPEIEEPAYSPENAAAPLNKQ